MEILKRKFLQYQTFEECAKDLKNKIHEDVASNILREFNLESIVRVRIFLSSFVIYYFPEHLINDVGEKDMELKSVVQKLFNEPDSLQKNIVDFSIIFEKWKGDDFIEFKSNLIDYYHGLSVEMLNVEDEQIKQDFLKTKRFILECAKKIDFEKELLNYIPVVFNTANFIEQSEKAFCCLIEEDIRQKKFDRLRNILSFFSQFFLLFSKKEKKQEISSAIDCVFIEQQFYHGVYEKEDYIALFDYMYNLMLAIQSRARDEFLLEKKKELENEKEVSVSKHLLYLYQLIENFMHDMNEMQNVVK
jgi:hypothetical protein